MINNVIELRGVQQATFDISKFSMIASLRGHKQRKWINTNNHGLFISLFVSSKSRYHAEF